MGNRHAVVTHQALSDEQIAQVAKKTNLTKQEILKWHAEFLRDCPSGRLDKKLFIQIYKQSFPMGDATKFCKICFIAFDKDKSGFIGEF